MAYCTRLVGEYPETEAQFIRDHLEARRYVYVDNAHDTCRIVGASRRGTKTIATTITGHPYALPAGSIIRVERA